MIRTDSCAAGDGRITYVKQNVWDDGGWRHDDGTRFRDGHVAQPAPQCPKCGSPKYVTEKTNPWTVRCMECGHKEESMEQDQETIRLTLKLALAEMQHRNDVLAASDLREPQEWMTPAEGEIYWQSLAVPEVREAAERIAVMGRKAHVALVVYVPDPERVTLHELGGSELLRSYARDGQSVRLESER